jgi:hypothetical protein
MDVNRVDNETLKKQEIIYHFFRGIAVQYPAKEVLKEFKGLFFDYYSYIENQEAITAIYDLTFGRYEDAFLETLQKCCYILIRNWVERQEYFCINELVKSFTKINKKSAVANTMMNRRDTWLENFVHGDKYSQLQAFVYHESSSCNRVWLPVYNYYHLVSLSLSKDNQLEQREAAEILAHQIKNDFKFQLGRYIGDVEANLNEDMRGQNPTHLGEQVVRLLKTLIVKRDKLNYANLAQIFIKQTLGLTYDKFKNSFHAYIMFSLDKSEVIKVFRQKSFMVINSYGQNENKNAINEGLINATCSAFLDCLTTNNTDEPSELFNLFVLKVNPLILTIIFLKIILVSPKSRETLDKNIATLINYYRQKNDQESRWFIDFLDIFNVTFTIYAEMDVQVYLKDDEIIFLVA